MATSTTPWSLQFVPNVSARDELNWPEATPFEGDFLFYDGAKWAPAPNTFEKIKDINSEVEPQLGDALIYDGDKYTPQPANTILQIAGFSFSSERLSTGVFKITHTEISPATAWPTVIVTPRFLNGQPAMGLMASVEINNSTSFTVRLNTTTGSLGNGLGFQFVVYSRGVLQTHGHVNALGEVITEGG